jgi:hypothetical protein
MTNKIISKAVKLINSDASFNISGGDIDTIQWTDGTTPIAKEDIEARLSDAETALANEEQAKIDEATAKATAKASGNTKLLDLGLTQAEATALTGYTPE